MDVQGRVVVVTGAGSGLGEVLAAGLAEAGGTVLVADRDGPQADRVAADLRVRGHEAIGIEVDVTDDADCHRLVERAAALGGPHVLVNNAGGWSEGGQQYPDAPADRWSTALALNLRAPMLLTQLVRAAVGDGGAVVVVNIASSAALDEGGGYGSPEYAAAKAGLVRFTTSMRGSPPVRAACVVPGWVGLSRAHAELAALPPAERARRPALVPPEQISDVVLRLVADDTADGAVVSLLGDDR